MIDNWFNFFVVRQCGSTYYIARKGSTHNPPISPDFKTKGQARTWIKSRWQQFMMEEILLGQK